VCKPNVRRWAAPSSPSPPPSPRLKPSPGSSARQAGTGSCAREYGYATLILGDFARPPGRGALAPRLQPFLFPFQFSDICDLSMLCAADCSDLGAETRKRASRSGLTTYN
jgi:hypothetical protein